MPTPPKPYAVLKSEQKSHRTKAELEQRRQGEEALLTGKVMQEWAATKAAPFAHKQFLRVRTLLKGIGKADALHESVVNRYCLMLAEEDDLRKERQRVADRQEMLEQWLKTREIDPDDFEARMGAATTEKINIEKALAVKRKMLLDIEKESVLTIASALRSIPKKVEPPKVESRMADILKRHQPGGGASS